MSRGPSMGNNPTHIAPPTSTDHMFQSYCAPLIRQKRPSTTNRSRTKGGPRAGDVTSCPRDVGVPTRMGKPRVVLAVGEPTLSGTAQQQAPVSKHDTCSSTLYSSGGGGGGSSSSSGGGGSSGSSGGGGGDMRRRAGALRAVWLAHPRGRSTGSCASCPSASRTAGPPGPRRRS